MNKEINESQNEMLSELLKSKEGREAYKKAELEIKEIFENWAHAKWDLVSGTDEDKEIAKKIIENSENALEDYRSALLAKLNNYLVDKVLSELKDILEKFVLSILIRA